MTISTDFDSEREAIATLNKLHEGKIGAHWIWCALQQIANGVSEEDALLEFGYVPSASADRNFCARCGKRLFKGDGEHIHTCAPPAAAQADADMTPVYEAFHIGSASRTPDVLLANVKNAVRRSACLSAIEREFFTEQLEDEDGPYDECALGWGVDPAIYVEQFRAALAPKADSTEPRAWTYRRYGSEPEKGYTIVAGREPIAHLGDGEAAGNAAQAICEAHNAASPASAQVGEVEACKHAAGWSLNSAGSMVCVTCGMLQEHAGLYNKVPFGGPWTFESVEAYAAARVEAALTAQPQADAGVSDAKRLDHLQSTGSTVELVPVIGRASAEPWRFRVGGLYVATHADLRTAIDRSIEALGISPAPKEGEGK